MRALTVLTCASAAAFLIYGVLGLTTQSVTKDFERFGLQHLRVLTGVLEILGGLSLLVGLKWLPALWIGSGGLSLLMFIAFAVRVRMRDSLAESLPSLAFAFLNLYILIRAIQQD